MKITELKGRLPEEAIESAVKRGIAELTEPQELSLKKGLLSGKHIVVASPTASGKTLIAEMAMLKTVVWERKKAVYVAPMRALVTEKYNELKTDYPYLKIAMSIGDLDSLDRWLDRYDIILVSTEKLDSLIRHGLGWLDMVGTFIFDEVHMLDDVSRGPTLEILITKVKRLSPNAQIIALSATIGNASEICEWIGGELVTSEFRPVPLRKGVEVNGSVLYNGVKEKLKGESRIAELRIAEDTLALGKQLIVFYASRRNAESGSERLAEVVSKGLSTGEREKLKKLADEVLNVLDKPTIQCERLAKRIESGVAFHHSGLVNRQRNLVEEAFRDGRIKAICATTTLCLPKGEEIIGNPEIEQIQLLNSEDKVLTHSGNFRRVILPTKRMYKGDLLQINTYFQLPMRMTPEHRVLVVKRKRHNSHFSDGKHEYWWDYSKPTWLEAKELKKGDMVLFPILKRTKDIKKIMLDDVGNLVNQTGVVGKHWTRLNTDRIRLDERTLEIMGLFIAEGSTGKNGVIKFDLNTNEEGITRKIEEWANAVGLTCNIRDNPRHRRSVVLCSKQVSSLFKSSFGHKARDKQIPHQFLFLPRRKLISLVRGMWLGDGSLYLKETYGCAGYITVSKVLAKQLFIILTRLGYMPSISYHETKRAESSNIGIITKDPIKAYRVRISGKQLTLFSRRVLLKDVRFYGNRSYNLGKIDNDYYYMPIRSIEKKGYRGEIYNLEVEADSSYVGSFIVHNSIGVNLPAHTVIVRDTSRYGGNEGMQKINVNEVLQLFGRAGRPKYDKEGRALLIAKSEEEAGLLRSRYIDAKPEGITSKLGVLPVLRTHVLAFIASGFLTRSDSILGFLSETFYGHQYSDRAGIVQILEEILEELTGWNFIEMRGDAYRATRIGEKVSELYIDPVSAKWIIDSIPKVNDEVSGLFMLTNTLEMRPYSKATEEAELELQQYYHMLKQPNDLESYYEPERPFSTALMLRDWISERSEAELLKKYGETPGSLYTKVSNADWLVYSSMELAKLMKVKYTNLLELRVRLRYGIRKELLDLVRLEQVGRVRARMMYNAGIKGVKELRKEGSEQRLERLFGKEIAKKIYAQVSAFAD